MSATATPTKMSGHEAHALLTREIFAPVFLQKLASFGIVPQTEEEAVRYISIGQKLLAADDHEQVKKAATKVDFLKQAESDLDREFQRRYGKAPATGPSPEEEFVTKTAAYLGGHAAIQQAVEAYNEAVAAEEAAAAA